MNFKKLLPFAVLLFVAASCNKSDSLSDNSMLDTDSNFELSTTTNSPNITYSVTIFPPNIATLTQDGSSIDIDWLSAGTGGMTFTAVNSCSGQTAYFQLPFSVAP